MALVTSVPKPNLWNEICKEFEAQRPPYDDPELESINTDLSDYDPSKHSPIFYGRMHEKVEADVDIGASVDPAISHPAASGHVFVERPPKSPPASPPPPPDYETCDPRDYLESFLFPTLLPALEEMLKQAKKERCFERKRTRFNALDFLTELLYYHNRSEVDRPEDNTFLDIEFVKEYLKDHPRPPLPLSLLWTEEEATLVIQSFWRGYLVRRDPAVQELRLWQKMWREEKEDVTKKVNKFWEKKMPGSENEQSNDVGTETYDCDDVTTKTPPPTFDDDVLSEPRNPSRESASRCQSRQSSDKDSENPTSN